MRTFTSGRPLSAAAAASWVTSLAVRYDFEPKRAGARSALSIGLRFLAASSNRVDCNESVTQGVDDDPEPPQCPDAKKLKVAFLTEDDLVDGLVPIRSQDGVADWTLHGLTSGCREGSIAPRFDADCTNQLGG
jgi:hypothetical protein